MLYLVVVYILYKLGQIATVSPWIWLIIIGLGVYKLYDIGYKIGKISKKDG